MEGHADGVTDAGLIDAADRGPDAAGGVALQRRAVAATAAFAVQHGRRPRILVAQMGQHGHDRGQQFVVSAYADLGFDVDVGPPSATPHEVARQAADADVHIVGVSTLAGARLAWVSELEQELAHLGRDDILIVVSGVVPPADVLRLIEAGTVAVFNPGTVTAASALDVLARLT